MYQYKKISNISSSNRKQKEQSILDGIKKGNSNDMDTFLEWIILICRRKFHVVMPLLEEKRKTATIMEEPSDGLLEKQKRGRRHGRK